MAELTKTQVSEKVKKALDWIVADSTTKANNAKTQAINEVAKQYLPLSGGSLTGTLCFTDTDQAITHRSGDNILSFGIGGSRVDRGIFDGVVNRWVFFLNNSGNTEIATSGTAYHRLVVANDGSLTHDGKNVVKSVNSTAADANGNVALSVAPNPAVASNSNHIATTSWVRNRISETGIVASGTNYMRFSNGVQIVWDKVSMEKSVALTTYTFPVPFVDANYCFSGEAHSTTDTKNFPYRTIVSCPRIGATATACTIGNGYAEDNFNIAYYYPRETTFMVIGRWK